VEKFRHLHALVAVAFAMASSATSALAACATNVVGQWLVTLNSGMTYPTSIYAGGKLQSHCSQCEPQTWTCQGNTFTVYGSNGVVVAHTIESSSKMRSAYSVVTRGGGGGTVKSGSSDCHPLAAPKAKRTDEWSMCFTAKNTNTNPKCLYGYTYKKGNARLPGRTLRGGESETQCSLAMGVDIEFEKWTKTAGSAR
jgi:hypothetical protein